MRAEFGSSSPTVSRVVARIRAGVRAWNEGRNDCHLRRYQGFATSYVGDTSRSARIQGDYVSTIEFGVLDRRGYNDCEGNQNERLLVACTYVTEDRRRTTETKAGTKYQATEADILFDSEDRWHHFVSRRRCDGEFDLWAYSSHEVGHVVGVAHHPGEWQTMYEEILPCQTYPRALGRVDYIGLTRITSSP